MFMKALSIIVLGVLAQSVYAAYGIDNNSGNNSNGGSKSSSTGRAILRFDTMYPVDGPFISHSPTVPNDVTIRDVLGDSLPWIIKKSIKGALFANGKLDIQVRGLIFPDAPNDEAYFRALVSCETVENNTVVIRNVITSPFRTGGPHNNPNLIAKGNANIRTRLQLPRPCIAPVIMILNGDAQEGDFWFAVTGS